MAVFTYISPLLVIATVVGYTTVLVYTSMVHENLLKHAKFYLGLILSNSQQAISTAWDHIPLPNCLQVLS